MTPPPAAMLPSLCRALPRGKHCRCRTLAALVGRVRPLSGRARHCLRPSIQVERVEADSASTASGKHRFGPSSWDGQVPWERSSMLTPKALAEEDMEEFILQEIKAFAPMQPRPLSMQEVLDMLEPERIAKFLHVEVPIRYAERIRWIQDIPAWEDLPDLVTVHDIHVQTFRELRLVERQPKLDQFTAAVQRAVHSQQEVRQALARGMHSLHTDRGSEYGSSFADPWLDKFLLNSIGTDMLLSQYLACVSMGHGERPTRGVFSGGIIDPDCDVAQICRDTAVLVQEITEEYTGRCPLIRVEVYNESGIPRFSYIPGFLKFILTELLKNSCRATVEIGKSDREVQKRPINVIVCADEHDVAIRISDRARGIPFEVGDKVWSYLYTTSSKGKGKDSLQEATSLSGYGMGLPLSRLYARYLGGSLNLVSLPGYGASADLFLTRVNAEQIEIVPDEDAE